MANESDLRAIFDEFDSDNSGQIDASELVGALKKVFGDEKTGKEINDLAAVSIWGVKGEKKNYSLVKQKRIFMGVFVLNQDMVEFNYIDSAWIKSCYS